MKKEFDIIVIGAGHAGVEAAFAGAKRGMKVLVATLSLDSIAFMACNPNIGGTAKGTLVKEVDALGGIIGIVADKTTIQTRMLNLANGPAVHSLRAQVDKNRYHQTMKQMIEKEENITLIESEVVEIFVKNKKVVGVKTALGDIYTGKTIIVTTGVFLKAKIIIGDHIRKCGPQGFLRAEELTNSLIKLGFDIRRFKTGTPARILARSVDFSQMEEQKGDLGLPTFSQMTDFDVENSYKCYLTYTNKDTHKIIMDNIEKAPLFNGSIDGVGARYCPSVEDKVVRFADKERHQIFIEPEGADTEEMYVQGLSTSMPFDVQEKMLHSIKGLEKAQIMRYAYAIEYDCIDPQNLLPSLAAKGIDGLFFAGQINGTSGYEEAAAQGFMAGINAANYLQDKESFVLQRNQAYIGVMIDDLITKGTNEPYRMMTSRAEYRLHLRQDNADIRLTELGRKQGTVDDARYERYLQKLQKLKDINEMLEKRYSPQTVAETFEKNNQSLPKTGIKGREILKRSLLTVDDLIAIDEDFARVDRECLTQISTEIKYEGYLQKQEASIREMTRMEERKLPQEVDYMSILGLRNEAKQKLQKIQPVTLAQASRISGVNPADIVVLMIWLGKEGQK